MNENIDAGVIRSANENEGTSREKRPSRHLLPKILCILAAFVLWLYVMQVESPEYEHEITSVAVVLENESVLHSEAGLSVYSGSGNRINVTVAGKKSIVTKLAADDVKAYIDLSHVKGAGRHSLEVSFDLPEDVTLVAVEPATVMVYVDETVSVSLPVSEKLVNFVMESPYELGEIDFEFDTVTVTGPRNKINNLASAVVQLDMEDKRSTFVTSSDILLIDKVGNLADMDYLSLSEQEMNVTVPIYMTRDVPVEVMFMHGLVDPDLIKVTCDPATVELKGDAAKFTDTAVLLDKIEIDDSAILTAPYTVIRQITARDGLKINSDSNEVKITVEYDSKIRTREFSIDKIKINGMKSGLEYTAVDSALLVKLRGLSDEIGKIKATDISAVVDLEDFDAANSGVITKNAEIKVSVTGTDSVFAVGTYPVKVKITQNEK